MRQDDLEPLLTEAATKEDAIIGCVRTADGLNVLSFEEWDIVAEWDEERQRLVLSVEIGEIPAARAGKVCEALLSYNSLWQQTGGVQLALTGPGGSLVQMSDLAAPFLGPGDIATVAANLADRAFVWRAYLASETPEDDLPAAATLTEAIRV